MIRYKCTAKKNEVLKIKKQKTTKKFKKGIDIIKYPCYYKKVLTKQMRKIKL